ncbi:MAG: sigma-54-dependent Fis family transcriptional regulator [Desulfovibrio sp.]|jgi:DNA-binding NtrC family response regulator|nr:sigma-54-dependent Fis family transcriptional regulator [Desulfovibrio sp.]
MQNKIGSFPLYPVLLVDDEEAWLQSLKAVLRSRGIDNIALLTDSRLVLEALAKERFCAVAVDIMMPHVSGEELIPRILAEHPEIPVLVISGLNQVKTAVNCIRLGAFDFIIKTEDRDSLVAGVRHAIEIFELRQENDSLRRRLFREELDHPEVFAEIITTSRRMRAVFQYVEAVAPTGRPVLITGESGVGKELIAQAIHKASGRAGRFVPVNVASLDDNIVADTLFGHKKGAYTGAHEARTGLIEQAKDGTLFLDEIGDLSQGSQTKLLRLLQEYEYLPLGSDIAKRSSARVIAATHQDLAALQEEGKFRKDLFFRLRGHVVHIPALRERLEDLPLLIGHFVSEAGEQCGRRIKADASELGAFLAGYPFPGNVRELQQLIHDAAGISRDGHLRVETLEALLGGTMVGYDPGISTGARNTISFGAELPTLKEARTRLIKEALARTGGNRSAAAQLIGITRQAVSKHLKTGEKSGE